MAIQPSSLNHRWTTPQKLFESLAAGTPVVASDLPGMAEIVEPAGAGLLADPTDPRDIAAKIRAILDAPAAERRALRERVSAAGREQFAWETQVVTLLRLYRELLGPDRAAQLRPSDQLSFHEAARPADRAADPADAAAGPAGRRRARPRGGCHGGAPGG